MSAIRRTTPAGPRVSRARSLAVALVLAAGASGCTGPAAPTPPAEGQRAISTPLAAYDADGPTVAPRDPCADMPGDRVADALDAEAEGSVTWAPGERLPGTSEVADEHGCQFTAGDVTASAWVFAAPTSPAQARRLAAEAAAGKCRRVRDAETFGDPAVAFSCGLNTGATLTGQRGLVGTWWVACEIHGTDDTQRVERWCAAVLESLSGG